MAYTPRAANAFKIIKERKLHEMPVLLKGDFNLDTRPGKNNDCFIEFMKEELGLEILKYPAQSTTLGVSAIDHVFTRPLPSQERKLRELLLIPQATANHYRDINTYI
jgi:endonuclease/exonuclease/phosphatase (EEP) superfamily protein YafD